MTEDEARDRVRSIVGSAAMAHLDRLVPLIVAENQRQNLIARSTVASIWARHVLDSVQLLNWADPTRGLWLDIGTGGGFPGLVLAMVSGSDFILAEPRRLRATFLSDAAEMFDLQRCTVIASRIERIVAATSFISARAVAPVEKLLQASAHCATADTRWLLLRGRLALDERQTLVDRTDMMFHVEQSLTDPDSSVVLVDRRRRQR